MKGEPGQDREARTEHDSKDCMAEDRIIGTELQGQESRDRKTRDWAVMTDSENKDKTVRKGQRGPKP